MLLANQLKSPSALNNNQQLNFVSPTDFGLLKSSAELELSPLDIHMPRVYGTRWILCFPISPGAEVAQMYASLSKRLSFEF